MKAGLFKSARQEELLTVSMDQHPAKIRRVQQSLAR
jgi:hypothetical protein